MDLASLLALRLALRSSMILRRCSILPLVTCSWSSADRQQCTAALSDAEEGEEGEELELAEAAAVLAALAAAAAFLLAAAPGTW